MRLRLKSEAEECRSDLRDDLDDRHAVRGEKTQSERWMLRYDRNNNDVAFYATHLLSQK